MLYLELRHVQAAIRKINHKYNTNIDIINRGQLEFALKKPELNIYGQERFPQLYQKAAVLMEALTKMHTLSDGNKRVAMMMARVLIDANGGHLVLPLKSIRLSVDTAMDEDDKMSDVIEQWFKVHTATDACSLSAMLAELDVEEDTIRDLLRQNREGDANSLLDKWMAFDNYPDNRKACRELIAGWRETQEMAATVSHAGAREENNWRSAWNSLLSTKDLPHSSYDHPIANRKDVHMPQYRSNNMAEMLSAEEQINMEVDKCKKAVDESRLLQNALRLERYGMYDDAIDMFKRLRDMVHDKAHAIFHIATNTQYGLGDAKLALKYWSLYLKHSPDKSDGHLHMGLALVTLERYADALTHLEMAPEKYPDINIYKGEAYAGMRQYDKAIEFYRMALITNPNSLDAHGLMGISYAQMGENQRALECFDRLIEIKPDYRGYYNKGVSLEKLDKYDDAIANYMKSLEINPDHLDSRLNLVDDMLYSGKIVEAIPHLLHVLDADPDHPIALYNMVDALTNMKRYDEALIYIGKIIMLNPSNTDAKYQKAYILLELGRRNECLKVLESLTKTDPEFNKAINSDAFKEAFGPILHDKRFKNIT